MLYTVVPLDTVMNNTAGSLKFQATCGVLFEYRNETLTRIHSTSLRDYLKYKI